jgi:hypothetical protein
METKDRRFTAGGGAAFSARCGQRLRSITEHADQSFSLSAASF